MDRRKFLRFSSTAVVSTPLITIGALANIGREKPARIEKLQSGDVLTSRAWNDIVDRLNLLSERDL